MPATTTTTTQEPEITRDTHTQSVTQPQSKSGKQFAAYGCA